MVEAGPATAEGRARVLLVQEESVGRARTTERLRSCGFEVVEVGTGLAAIETATSGAPDLLLVDLHLPDLDGAEVASRLRRLGFDHLPIVGMGEPKKERGLALTAGCDGTVPSPPDLEVLPSLLREFLAGKRDRLRLGDERRYLKVYTQELAEKVEAKVRELTGTLERLKTVDAFKTAFMRSISHELASPLTPLAGYIKILQTEKLGPLNERQKKIVDTMLQSADRLARTIDNLADFAVLEASTYQVRTEPVDVPPLLGRLVEEAQADVAKAKRVHISTVGTDRPLTLTADGARLRQAVGNLLDNAVKFSPHGGEVLLEVAVKADRVQIAVYDQGAGVPPEDQEKIFEPFYHAQGAQHVAVAGLGLPVARKIAQAHGGRLWVETPPKEQPTTEHHFSGARFVLEIPVRP